MKFSKALFILSFFIAFLLVPVFPAVSRTYGIPEDANTYVPAPQIQRRPTQGDTPDAARSSFIVSYTGFTPEARTAFEYATSIWAAFIQTSVPIQIDATFEDFGNGSGLAYAGPTRLQRPSGSDEWLPIALVNANAGRDLETSFSDIQVTFNSNSRVGWYYGTDGDTPAGKYDFVTLALHELAHGLGYLSATDVSENALGVVVEGHLKHNNFHLIYDIFIVNRSGTALTTFEDPSAALLAQLTSNNLYWDGTDGKAANSGNRPRLYAPSTWSSSACSHLNESTYPKRNRNSLMTPFFGSAEAIHHPGPITLGMLEDIGWTINYEPAFAAKTVSLSVAENTVTNVNIGDAVEATDANSDDTLTYSLSGTDAASFDIVSSSGQLKTKAALDHETKSAYSVTVTANDGVFDATTSVTINVTDVNESPVFADNTTTRSIAENTSVNQNIGAVVSATDVDDGDTLAYTLSGTDAASFDIVSSSGQLKTKAALNHETKSTYSVTVTASDSDLSDTISVTINVTDINEKPVFATNTTTRSIAENTSADENISTPVSATDEDDGDTLAYTLSGTDAASFDIASRTGQLKTKTALDHETRSSYRVTVTANDGDLSDTISVTINVTDINERPVFADGSTTTRAIVENTPANRNIGAVVSATDDDRDTLAYTLSGTDAASFDIVSSSGQLKTKAALNHETKSTYSVTVTASDGDLSDTISVTINVTDINEAPVFADGTTTTRSIAENTSADENISTAVSATDEDDGDTLAYTLSGTNAASFAIDSTNGQLKTKAALDHETKSTYSVRITVSDGTASDRITVTINVTDVNEKPVFAGDTTTRSILEGTAADENIGAVVSATDDDEDTLAYTLGGTDAASFDIVSSSGQLKTKAALNRATKSSYSVTVTASDGNLSATTSVAINGTAAANEAPVFATNTATRSIAENTAAGENIGAVVSATDGDADTLAYTLSGTNAASFAIVSSSGQLKTKAALNHETKSSYRVTVTASDGDLSDTISVTINVTDVNEMPVFADGSTTTRAIVENTPANRNIGTAVSATDDDRDTLAYTLGGTDAASFDIVSSSGQLKTKTALNHETKSVYRVTVTASDGDLDEAISVTINVTDVNERPVFAEGTTTTRSIAENTSVNQNISTAVSATDEDDGDTLAYTLSGTNAASFNIDSTNGQLKTKVALNHETKSTYSVRITVSDGTVSATISVTINVTDVNEKPVFATNTITYSIVEHTPAGRNIGAPVSATDEDSDDTLTYTLGGTNATSFDLVSTTGQLKTKAALNYDIKNTYSVTITATDEGGLRDAISVTINIINVIGFTDSRLAAAVRSALRIASDAPIRPERLAALTSLTASRRNITDLTGLEQATGLTRLDLGDNQIDDLDPLENLTNLTNLDIANNQIDDVSSLSRLINLTNLDLDDNQIVDVSSLPSLSSLQILDLRSNNVGDVTPLSTMTTLKQLYLSGNENLSNIKFLVDLKAVARTSIDITLPRPVTIRDDNLATAVRTALNNRHGFNLQAGDSIFPEDMERLTELDTSNASITTLTGLETATGLTSLDLSKNTISSISPLSRLTQLESLDLSENTISSISSLSGLTALTDLNLSTNRISSVSSLSRLIGLTRLDLSENTISSLSTLSKLTALTTLYLANNRITDVLALQGLSSLSILDLSGNTGLTTEKAAVLYKLEQVGTIIFLPPGITLPARANIVVFNNAALEAAVRSRLRIRTGYPILTDNITDMTTLTATSKQIDDLTGLAAATGLTRLDLGNNAIVNLTPYRT